MQTMLRDAVRGAGWLVRQGGTVLLAAVAGFTLACGEQTPDRAPAAMEEVPMQGMESPMATMAMPSMDMLPAVRAYVDSVLRAQPGELPEFVGGHRARIERMREAMDVDMRAMRMTADAAWIGLTDSVRADLAAIPGLSGEELVLRMRAHAGRLRRWLAMHERMMGM